MSAVPLLIPDWPLPRGVGAAMATRIGGVGTAPYDSLNLRPPSLEPPGAPADDPQAVGENIRRYGAALGAQPVFLRQVHGAQVLNLDEHASPVQS
ncbi:MAG: laccase domain-containing protein, partial [Betaproteobacteria bacterium]